MSRHTRAIINLANIRHNFEMANRWAPESRNMAIIKADAYGHGAIEVAKTLAPMVPAFGVAIFEEAVALRNAGIKNNILVLQGVNEQRDILRACELELWLTIHNLQQLESVLLLQPNYPLKLWLKLDTGMHRLGLNTTEFAQAVDKIKACKWLDSEFVVSSHFACASQLDNIETEKQKLKFDKMIDSVHFDTPPLLSLANSPAIIAFPEGNLSWNRPGIMLYGVPMFDTAHSSDQEIKAAMTFESEIIALRTVRAGESVGYGKQWTASKDSIIATVAVGYADGYPRHAQSGTPVLVNGQEASLAGTVSMDLISVDVSEINNVKVGDRVELWGETLSVARIAKCANTIGYDLVTGVGSRVPRIYQ